MRVLNSQDLYESYLDSLDESETAIEAYVPFEGKPSRKLAAKQNRLADRWDEPGVEKRFHKLGDVASRETGPFNLSNFRKQEHRDRDARTARIRKQKMGEEFELWVNELVNEGYDLSEYTWDEMYELYESYDSYITVVEHLIDEEYVEDLDSAEDMIMYMSEEWLEEILESKKWIQAAIKKPGALSKSLGVPEKKNIPVKMLKKASGAKGKLGKRARLALTLRKFH